MKREVALLLPRYSLIFVKARRPEPCIRRRMTDELSFVVVAVALLVTPGPTNTLLATSGAASGFRKSLVLLLGEFLGYLIAIALLITVMGPIVARVPNFGFALRIVSGLYLLHVAWKLWGHTEEMLLGKGGVSLRHVFVTTLLNPKALIFAFAIIPFGSTGDIWKSAPWLAALSPLIAIVGSCWIAAGTALQRGMGGRGSAHKCYQAGAIVLTLFAALICGTAIVGRLVGALVD
jgi:threonine/homoserine/homoserine lactone efflux protein